MREPLLIAAALLCATSTVVAQSQITGSSHDLRGYVGNGGTIPSTGQVCIFCHTPHNALVAVPLWNHASSGQTFQMYGGSSTIQGAIAGSPAGVSLQCLSCHDGVTNLDAYGGVAGGIKMATGAAAIMGTDLRNDHPISVTYRNDLDADLAAPTGATVGGLPLFGAASPYTVECGSCHEVHGAGFAKFLRATNDASAMCTTCHSK